MDIKGLSNDLTAIEECSSIYIRRLSKINVNIMIFILLLFGMLVKLAIDMIRLYIEKILNKYCENLLGEQ